MAVLGVSLLLAVSAQEAMFVVAFLKTTTILTCSWLLGHVLHRFIYSL